jgi:PAS domain S-box-containing protein
MKKESKQKQNLSSNRGDLSSKRDILVDTPHKYPNQISANEAPFRTFVESATASIVIFQGNKFKYVNPSHELLTGYSAKELVTMNFWDYAHPDFKALVKERGLARQKGDPTLPSSWAYKILTKKGEERWIQVRPSYFTYEGKPAAIATVINVTDQKRIEEELERQVNNRTADLSRANKLLKQEIIERKKIATALRKRDREISKKSENLERVNIALSVLLKRREEDKDELEEKILSNVKEIVMPYIKKFKKMRLSNAQMDYVNILESHLSDIVSPFLHNLKSRYFNFTPREIEIAILVKEGKRTKDIAELLGCSQQTVDFHRFNIRNKLGMRYKKSNLRSGLLSFK